MVKQTGDPEVKILKHIYVNQAVIHSGQRCFVASANEFNNATQMFDEVPVFDEEKQEYSKTEWQYTIAAIMKAQKKKNNKAKDEEQADVANEKDEEAIKAETEKKAATKAAIAKFLQYYAKSLKDRFPIYSDYGVKLLENLDSEKCLELELEKLQMIVKEVMKIATVKERTDALKLYVGQVSAGRIVGKFDLEKDEFIYPSITGFWEKKEKL